MIRRLALIGCMLAAVVAVGVWPLASHITSGATTAWLITPHAEPAVKLNRDLYAFDHEGRQPVAADADPASPQVQEIIRIYGNPTSEPIEVVWVEESAFLHPAEMPSLTLLPQDKQAGDNAVQVQTVWFLTRWVSLGAAIVAGAMLLLWVLLALRHRRAPDGA